MLQHCVSFIYTSDICYHTFPNTYVSKEGLRKSINKFTETVVNAAQLFTVEPVQKKWSFVSGYAPLTIEAKDFTVLFFQRFFYISHQGAYIFP